MGGCVANDIEQYMSEQNSIFLRKKNRNIIKIIDSNEIKSEKNFIWLTIGQIKQLSLNDNIVNMDLRSIISGLTFLREEDGQMKLKNSQVIENRYQNQLKFYNQNKINSLRNKLSYYIEKNKRQIDFINFDQLSEWSTKSAIIEHNEKKYFKVIGTKINLIGREVENWEQPLIRSIKSEHNVLFYYKDDELIQLLVQFKIECGSSQIAEIAPSIQTSNYNLKEGNEKFFYDLYTSQKCKHKLSVKQSAEGGRFYKEENLNTLIEVSEKQRNCIKNNVKSDRYNWIELCNIIHLIKQGGPVNMQLRGILAMISSTVIE